MKIYKFIRPQSRPFVLCNRSVGRSYFWASENQAGQRALDLPHDDALVLAKLLKLLVCEFNPHRAHVGGVLDGAQLDKVEPVFGLVPCFVVFTADTFNDVTFTLGSVENFTLNGLAHIESLQMVEKRNSNGVAA